MRKFYESQLESYSHLTEKISQILKESLEKTTKTFVEKAAKSIKLKKTSLSPQKPKESTNTESTKDLAQLYVDDVEKKQFLHKLKLEKKLREERIKTDLEAKSKKFLEELEKARALEIQAKEKQKEEKLKQILEKQEQLALEKKIREEEFDKSNKELRKVSSVKPLFKELEDRFTANVELPELEQRKKELARKRQIFAPMNVKDLLLHSKQYEAHLDRLNSKRKTRALESHQDDLINSSCHNLYKSKIFELIQQSEKEEAESQHQKEINRKLLKEKSKRYGEIVYELFKPTVSVHKSLDKAEPATVKSVPRRKLQLRKSVQDLEEKPVRTSRTKSNKGGLSRIKRITSAAETKPEASVDYLAERRKYRQEHSSKMVRVKGWKEVQDLGLKPEQKLEKIESQVKLLENQTKSYEMLTGVHKDLLHGQSLNQSYVEVIKAKLAYLTELSNQ